MGKPAAPTPVPAGKVTVHRVVAAIKLTGVTKAMLAPGSKGETASKNTVSAKLKICGKDGKSQCTGADVVIDKITAARRAGVTVDFYVKTSSATAAAAGATSLNTVLEAGGGATFVTDLKAAATKAGATDLGKATITMTVTKKAAAKAVVVPAPTPAPKKVSAAPATAVVSMASVAFAALALW